MTVGGGKRLFGDGTIPGSLKLLESSTTSSGVIVATYERKGEVRSGSFALEKPTVAELERRKRLALEK